MGRRRRSPVVVIPAREFINKVSFLNAFIPEGVYLDEANFIGNVFDNVFNELDIPISEIARTCFHMVPHADLDDIAFARGIIDENFSHFADLLRLAKDNARDYMPSYNYVDLVRISWDTKSLYLKVL